MGQSPGCHLGLALAVLETSGLFQFPEKLSWPRPCWNPWLGSRAGPHLSTHLLSGEGARDPLQARWPSQALDSCLSLLQQLVWPRARIHPSLSFLICGMGSKCLVYPGAGH